MALRHRNRLNEADPKKVERKHRVRLSDDGQGASRRNRRQRPRTSQSVELAIPPGIPPEMVLLTTAQAAACLNISIKTLNGWRVRGVGPAYVKMGRAVRYFLSEVWQFAQRQQRTSTSEPQKHR